MAKKNQTNFCLNTNSVTMLRYNISSPFSSLTIFEKMEIFIVHVLSQKNKNFFFWWFFGEFENVKGLFSMWLFFPQDKEKSTKFPLFAKICFISKIFLPIKLLVNFLKMGRILNFFIKIFAEKRFELVNFLLKKFIYEKGRQ